MVQTIAGNFDYIEFRRVSDDRIDVLGFKEYPIGSVLEGQMGKHRIESIPLEEALKKYGQCPWYNRYISAQVSVAHLPGPDDYESGFHDTWEDGE